MNLSLSLSHLQKKERLKVQTPHRSSRSSADAGTGGKPGKKTGDKNKEKLKARVSLKAIYYLGFQNKKRIYLFL